MKALDENLDVVEYPEFNNYLDDSNKMGVQPYSSTIENICWCGHERHSHCGLNKCNEKDCNCSEFSP